LAVALAAVAMLPTAAGAQTTWPVKARDGSASCPGLANCFVPDQVEAEPGDAVSWEWDLATTIHDLWLARPGEEPVRMSDACREPGNPLFGFCQAGDAPIVETVTEEGVYPFYCTVHGGDAEGNGMAGIVVLGEGAPPGPSPLPNPTEPPSRWEEGDNVRPRLRGVRARGLKRGARVRFRLSEPGRVVVRFKHRGTRLVYAKRLRRLPRGVTRVRIRSRRLRAGRYVLVLRATDRAGNRSRRRSRWVTVKGY
jgi:plastocyanin